MFLNLELFRDAWSSLFRVKKYLEGFFGTVRLLIFVQRERGESASTVSHFHLIEVVMFSTCLPSHVRPASLGQ